jgi:hypothetical protein
MIGLIIILIRLTKPVPSGLSPRSEVRGEETYGDAGEHGQDDGDVQPMRAVPAWRGIGLCPSADRIAGAVPASGAGCSRALAG